MKVNRKCYCSWLSSLIYGLHILALNSLSLASSSYAYREVLLTTSFVIDSEKIIVLSKQGLCKTHLVWFEQFLEVTSIFIERWVFVIDCHQMQQSDGIKLGLKLGLKHDLHTICSKIGSPSGWVFSMDVSLLPFFPLWEESVELSA